MRCSTQPADIATLAWAVPGQEVVIAAILSGAGPECAKLRPGATVLCQEVTASDVVIRGVSGHPMHIPLDQADRVQIERIRARPLARPERGD
jgi:hypothetical protein